MIAIEIGDLVQILNEEEFRRLRFYWGSLAQAMLALFLSISGGVSWVEIVVPLMKIDMFWLATFLVFDGFVYFAVLNVVTGVFCQSAIESAQKDEESMLHSFLA